MEVAYKFDTENQKSGNFITVMSGAEDGRVYQIRKDLVSIGKSDNNDIPLRTDSSLVANHAFLLKEAGKYYICMNNKKEALNSGEIFTVGGTELKIKYFMEENA